MPVSTSRSAGLLSNRYDGLFIKISLELSRYWMMTSFMAKSQHVQWMLLWVTGLTSQQLVPCLWSSSVIPLYGLQLSQRWNYVCTLQASFSGSHWQRRPVWIIYKQVRISSKICMKSGTVSRKSFSDHANVHLYIGSFVPEVITNIQKSTYWTIFTS